MVASRKRGRPSNAEKAAAAAAQAALKNPGSIQAKYDAGGNGRRMSSWNPPASGPNRAITELPNIRNRARDLGRNDWSGTAATQKWVTNLIGIGIVPRFKRVTDKARKQVLNDAWSDFVNDADADGVLNFYGMQTLAVRSWFESGEVFLRWRARDASLPLSVPMQVQMVESEFVPQLDADSWPGMAIGNTIRQGIERNKFGRRVAYWMYREHPGDFTNLPNIDMTTLLRVPADQVCHIYEPKRPGQLRGVSELAPIITRLRNVNDFDDAVLERQKLANLFMAFVKRDLPQAYDTDFDPLTNLPLSTESDGTPLASLQPGTVQELLPGEDVTFANPPEAGTTYSDYMRTQHLGTASGGGLPYELLSGDIRQVSDRTLRLLVNEFRRFCEQRQWQIVIPQLCMPVIAWWADAMVLSGQASNDEADALRRAEWSPHGWPYMHPVQDAQAKQIEVNEGFRSRSSVIAENGDDPEQVDEERAEDQKRSRALGLPDPVPVKAPPGEQNLPPGDGGGSSGDGSPSPSPAPAPANQSITVINQLPGAPPAPEPTAAPEPVARGVRKVVDRDPVTGAIVAVTEYPITE